MKLAAILAASLCLVIGAVLMASRCRALTEQWEPFTEPWGDL